MKYPFVENLFDVCPQIESLFQYYCFETMKTLQVFSDKVCLI